MSRPNVLFLFSDEHNAKCLGHAERDGVHTPNLDRLAREGTRFRRAVAQSPICTPSRVSFASGQYPHNHGHYGLAGPVASGPDLLQHVPHVFGHFRAHGYRVASIGKTHLPPGWVEDACDRFVEHKDLAQGFPAYLRAQGVDPGQSTTLSWGERVRATDPPKFAHDFLPDELPYEHTPEHWKAREAIAFLERHREEPVFMQVGFWRPHTPCTPTQAFWDLYPQDERIEPPNADVSLADKPVALQRKREQLEAIPPHRLAQAPRTYEGMRRRYQRGYLGTVSQVDHAVGEILDALDRLDVAKETIVVYSSDHGDFAGELGLTEKAPGIWSDAVTRIPMIWRFPGRVAAGHACDALVESVDFAPTVCALAGAPEMPTADGASLVPLLEGGDRAVREIAVTETPRARAVYDGRFRLVHASHPFAGEADPGVLCDLVQDPWETRNLYRDAAHAPPVQAIRRRLLDWLVNTQRVTTAHPAVDDTGAPSGSKAGGRPHRVDADGRRGPAYLDRVAEIGDAYL